MSVNYRKLRKGEEEEPAGQESGRGGEDNHDGEIEEEKGRVQKIGFNKSHKLSCVLGMTGGKCPHNSAALWLRVSPSPLSLCPRCKAAVCALKCN